VASLTADMAHDSGLERRGARGKGWKVIDRGGLVEAIGKIRG
jgi:hypothetical protein